MPIPLVKKKDEVKTCVPKALPSLRPYAHGSHLCVARYPRFALQIYEEKTEWQWILPKKFT
mgnify:FL=1